MCCVSHIDRGSNGTISRASPPTAGPPGPPGPPAPPPSPPPAVRPKRKAARDVILRWPGAEVPYQLARGHFSPKERYVLKQAMTEWERYTCLKFRPATNADVNVVRFQNGEGWVVVVVVVVVVWSCSGCSWWWWWRMVTLNNGEELVVVVVVAVVVLVGGGGCSW